ncbi:hypothetical protein QJS10_CPA05g02414 [Acorus calamus]|uniref:Uncharacterized protein n=1 Tax=Acorus calamus TaxID=4465 RepID=A0AAV9EXX9_ACOCL|nr:hypothetical protein QJS10_CPA05g02414 [Acorus calamus]
MSVRIFRFWVFVLAIRPWDMSWRSNCPCSQPVHGRLSEIEHIGCDLFDDIPSGRRSGFKVVRYHSLVIDADSLPKELIPIAWTASLHTHSYLETYEYDMMSGINGNRTDQILSSHSSPLI